MNRIEMHRLIAFEVLYDGTRYYGWQKTKEGPSIEAALESTLERILQKKPSLQAASRTDRGVHARGQIVSFLLEKEISLDRLKLSMNRLLFDDIKIGAIFPVEEKFHPALDAQSKDYIYRVMTGIVPDPFFRITHWHHPYVLDIDVMRKAGAMLIGTRDFSHFANRKKEIIEDSVRTLFLIDITKKGTQYEILLRGDRFLYKMARNIAGALIYLGSGKISIEDFKKLFYEGIRPKRGITAPSLGLTLEKIYYRATSMKDSILQSL